MESARCAHGAIRWKLVTNPFGEDVQIRGLSINRVNKPPLVCDAKVGPSLATRGR